MNETLLLEQTQRIAVQLSKKNEFGIYDQDDITQEIYLLVRQAYPKFNEGRGTLDQFLFHYVNRRLLTLKRDKQACPRSKNLETKMKIHYPEELREDSSLIDNIHDFLDEYTDFIGLVDKKIPSQLRMRYLQLLEGVPMSSAEQLKIIDIIKTIVRVNSNDQT